MVFNSQIFAVFLVLVFFLYWFVFQKTIFRRNLFLLVVSYIFYGWWDWRFLSLLFLTSCIDYITAFYIDKTNLPLRRKYLLAISIVSNISVLCLFKYYNFFVSSFVEAANALGLHLHAATLNIILPVGISFYTFQSLSYTIDVYRRNLKASNNIIAFLAFVSFFPQLVAGPIERAKHLLPQFFEKKVFDNAYAINGLRLMLYGFFKKIVIADSAAFFVNTVFAVPENYHGLNVILAAFFFAVQIYGDFSGYSDIAIGCARLFGFSLMQNFNTPYFSASPKEFWQRWHISLSTWFRDYVYIPLGGNRKGNSKTLRNLMLTFLISGLWHGANFTFIVWGALHGTAVCVQTFFEQRKIKLKIHKSFAIFFTLCFTVFAWIFFRAANMHDASLLVQNLFHGYTPGEENICRKFPALWSELSVSLLLFVILEVLIQIKTAGIYFFRLPVYLRWCLYYGLIIWILFYGEFDVPPSFIYFQF